MVGGVGEWLALYFDIVSYQTVQNAFASHGIRTLSLHYCKVKIY